MGMADGAMATVMDVKPLEEPYQRFPSNQLRRECYRRKLAVIKSGPQTNATKAGYLQLLREADAQERGNDAKESEMPSESKWSETAATAPTLVLEPAPLVPLPLPLLPRMVTPPTSPMASVQVAPTRPPRVEMAGACGAKRGMNNLNSKQDVVVASEKKRRKTTNKQQKPQQPQLVSDNSFVSTQVLSSTTSSAASVSKHHAVSTDVSVCVEVDPKTMDQVEQMPVPMPRWERLHARLEVVTTKLVELYGRREEWPRSAIETNDDSDVAFYELMRRQLQRSLLECVAQA